MPAAAGTLRYENETWSLEVFGCGWCHPSPLDSGFRRNDEVGGRNGEGMLRMANERLPEQSIFIAMTNSVAGTIRFRSN